MAQPAAAPPPVEIVAQTRHTLGVNSAVISPAGRFVASSGEDQVIKLWDVKTGRLIRNVTRVPREVKYWRVVALSLDGRKLLAIESDQLKLWDTSKGTALLSLPNSSSGDNGGAAEISADGRRVAAIVQNGAVRIYDADTGKEAKSLAGHAGPVGAVAFSPDGRRIVTGGQDRTVRIWDAISGQPLRSLQGAGEPMTAVAFTKDARHVFSHGGSELRLWNAETGALVWQHADKEMTAASMAPDGRRVLIERKPGPIEIWDAIAGTRVASHAPPENTELLGFSANGERLVLAPRGRDFKAGEAPWVARFLEAATGRIVETIPGVANSVWADRGHLFVETADSSLSLRDLETGREVQTFGGQPAITASALSASGARVASAAPGRVLVRDANSGRRIGSCPAGSEQIRALSISPDEQQLLYGGEAKQIGLCDIATQRVLRTFEVADREIRSLAFAADGKRFLSGSGEGNVKQWSIETGRVQWSFQGTPDRDIAAVAFSPDGRRAFAGTDDNRVRILEAGAGRELKVLRMLIGPVWTLAVSPDGKRIAAGGYSEVLVKQWDAETGNELLRLNAGHPAGRFVRVDDIRYSAANGGLLAAASNNRVVMWRIANGRKALDVAINDQELKSVAFSRDGKRVIAVDEGGAIRHWASETGALLLTIVPFGDEEWLAVTPEGFFDASPKGDEYLSVVRGLDVQPIGQLKGRLHRRDLVADKLAGDPKGAVREAARKLDLGR